MQSTVQIQNIPQTIEEFTVLRDSLATTPEGGAAVFVAAMLTCVKNRDLGIQFFTLILEKEKFIHETTHQPHVKGYAPNASFMFYVEQLDKQPWIAPSYVQGTSADNGYTLPTLPYTISTLTDKHSVIEEGKWIKIFLECTGRDTARPISMKKNNKGIWKVNEVSSLFVGITKPKSDDGDDL